MDWPGRHLLNELNQSQKANTEWFCLYYILEDKTITDGKQTSTFQGLGARGGCDYKGVIGGN